jgi:hypothetical protein
MQRKFAILSIAALGGTLLLLPAVAQSQPFHHHHHHHRGIGGFGLGLGLGVGLASPYYGYNYGYAEPYDGDYYAAAPDYNASVQYCMDRFKSYDVRSRTYLGYDGERHSCP